MGLGLNGGEEEEGTLGEVYIRKATLCTISSHLYNPQRDRERERETHHFFSPWDSKYLHPFNASLKSLDFNPFVLTKLEPPYRYHRLLLIVGVENFDCRRWGARTRL